MHYDDNVKSSPAALALPISVSERAELRRQKILAKGAERMSKVTGMYSKSSSDALVCSSQGDAIKQLASSPSPSDSANRDETSHRVESVAADAGANQSTSLDDDDLIPVQRSKSVAECELPSIRDLRRNADELPRASPALRAPGVRAFHTVPAPRAPRAAAPSSSRTFQPLARGFWWRVALWAVTAAFCAAVCAHTLQLLPRAPYVLMLIAVMRLLQRISRVQDACFWRDLVSTHYCEQAAAIITALSRFTVRTLAYQANMSCFGICCCPCTPTSFVPLPRCL
jgi:hypothetical protein